MDEKDKEIKEIYDWMKSDIVARFIIKMDALAERECKARRMVCGNGHWSLGYDSVKAAEAALETPPN